MFVAKSSFISVTSFPLFQSPSAKVIPSPSRIVTGNNEDHSENCEVLVLSYLIHLSVSCG